MKNCSVYWIVTLLRNMKNDWKESDAKIRVLKVFVAPVIHEQMTNDDIRLIIELQNR